MDISELIQTVDNEFTTIFSFPLFSQIPASNISELNNPVNDKDSFITRLTQYSTIFDNFNKKEMDTITGGKTQGTRECLENFLKSKLKNEQIFIDDKIINPMKLFCLLRDYVVHGRNRNKGKAISYFKLSDPIEDFESSWKSAVSVYQSIFLSISFLLKSVNLETIKSSKLNKETEDLLVRQFIADCSYYFEDRRTNALFREIIEKGPVSDVELAKIFNINVIELRRILYPFVDKLILTQYKAYNETLISLKPYFYDYKDIITKEMAGNP